MSESVKIKICGLSRECDILAVNQLEVDYVGFVFASGSRRQVSAVQAEKLRALLRRDIKVVGVFVRESVSNICKLHESGVIDIAQLHGGESEEQIRAVQACGIEVIKAISVNSRADILSAESSCADYILFDNGTGGTGQVFEHSLLDGLDKLNKRCFVAGGLSESNVTRVLGYMPYAVDVSGGVEKDGRKDEMKIQNFVRKVRQ